jgi:hypothetical protein
MASNRLVVEGVDDEHSIYHLLSRNGIQIPLKDSPDNPQGLPHVAQAKSVEKLINSIEVNVKACTDLIVGFVLDADTSVDNRWKSVSAKLASVGVLELPKTLSNGGFIGESTEFRTRVGVWIMPDNISQGMLEDFLISLIHKNDILISHAEDSTNQAKQKGAEFSDPHRIKAVIHTWLAWQREPGKPFGIAMKAEYFQQNSPTADTFVRWFRELYRIK